MSLALKFAIFGENTNTISNFAKRRYRRVEDNFTEVRFMDLENKRIQSLISQISYNMSIHSEIKNLSKYNNSELEEELVLNLSRINLIKSTILENGNKMTKEISGNIFELKTIELISDQVERVDLKVDRLETKIEKRFDKVDKSISNLITEEKLESFLNTRKIKFTEKSFSFILGTLVTLLISNLGTIIDFVSKLIDKN